MSKNKILYSYKECPICKGRWPIDSKNESCRKCQEKLITIHRASYGDEKGSENWRELWIKRHYKKRFKNK